jgi:hypothetical protein
LLEAAFHIFIGSQRILAPNSKEAVFLSNVLHVHQTILPIIKINILKFAQKMFDEGNFTPSGAMPGIPNSSDPRG